MRETTSGTRWDVDASTCVSGCACVRECACVRASAPHVSVTAPAHSCKPGEGYQRSYVFVPAASAVCFPPACSIQVTSWAYSSSRAPAISDNFGCQSCQWKWRLLSFNIWEGECHCCLWQEMDALGTAADCVHGSSSRYRDKLRMGFLFIFF